MIFNGLLVQNRALEKILLAERFSSSMGKTAMKKTPLPKGILKHKAMKVKKGKPLSKGAGSSTDKKPPMKSMKKSLKKAQLHKLGKLTLEEKVERASAGADTPDEAATSLRKMLTKQEHSRVWSKAQTQLAKKDKKEQKEFAQMSKAEKGQYAAVALVKGTIPKFFNYSDSVVHDNTLAKREKWQSEKTMVDEFGPDEFWKHVESGRIESREDPWTWGIYQYRDRGDVTKWTQVKRKQEWSQGQEYSPDEDDEEEWHQFSSRDLATHLVQAGSKGKGKSLTKGKGGGKQKGKKGAAGQLALEDGQAEEKSEEDMRKEVLTKAKKGRDQALQAKEDCPAAMKEADLAKRLTKASKNDVELMCSALEKKVKQVNPLLSKGKEAMALDKAKQLLVELMHRVKEVKNETKELKQQASRAGSKTSKK